MGLSDGRKSFPIGLTVLIQYRSVTASHPASHVAVAITLNANASSLKTEPKERKNRICSTTIKLEKITRKASDAAEYIELFGSSARGRYHDAFNVIL